MDKTIVPVKNALLSVFYKDGIVEMAQTLQNAGVGLYSSGGTAKVLREANLSVTEISDLTEYPAMFGHRVVTLHPKVHGGILYRRDNPQDLAEVQKYDIVSLDLVVVNLYPVEKVIADPNVNMEKVVENIDIGGPTLIRGAAKNHKFVGAVVDPADYQWVAELIGFNGGLTDRQRLRLATKVFKTIQQYDKSIADFFAKQ